jgi:hypothetical protein
MDLPDPEAAFSHELSFMLTCGPSRLGKLLSLYELYRMVVDLPGAVVECGVFKGSSLAAWAGFRSLMESPHGRRIVGFDTFNRFPAADESSDQAIVAEVERLAGLDCISVSQARRMLTWNGRYWDTNVELVAGDITSTAPDYISRHPELKIALLMLDVDLYAPARTVLDEMAPHIVRGGILVIDNYGTFPGETRAADEFLSRNRSLSLTKPRFSSHLTLVTGF